MTAPTLGQRLATKLITQGHATEADQPLIERFAEAEPQQAKRLADVASEPSRLPKYFQVLERYADEPRFSDRHGSGQTMRSELNQANALATWFTPVGAGSANAEHYLQAHAVVKSLVDLPLMSSGFSRDERDRLMDIAGDMAFAGSEEDVAVSWRATRQSKGDRAAFARDLATLQEAAMVMTPKNVATGEAANGLAMVAPMMKSTGGQRLAGTMKLTADLAYDGQVAIGDYDSDHAMHGPWKQVLGRTPEHVGTHFSLDTRDRMFAQRAATAPAQQQAHRPDAR
ncbi:MAG: hypothetical protein AAF556_08755 [Pseudomonadota bacterium]